MYRFLLGFELLDLKICIELWDFAAQTKADFALRPPIGRAGSAASGIREPRGTDEVSVSSPTGSRTPVTGLKSRCPNR